MTLKVLKCSVIAMSVMCLTSNMAWANSINTQALDFAGQKKFDQALALLSQQDAKLQSAYEHRFLKSRILSWAGKYGEARTELEALMDEYPGNADLELTLGNLEYYQGNLKAAEKRYKNVLAIAPDYQDARNGLETVKKARTAAKGTGTWRIDGSLGLTDFNGGDIPSWDEQFLRAEYSPGDLAYHGSVRRYRRFERTDVELKGGISDAVSGGWDWGLEAGVTPNSTFRPKLSLGGRLGRSIETENGTVFYPNVSYRYDDYTDNNIQTIQPGLITYLDNGLVLTGRLIATLQDDEDDQLGWLVEGRIPVTETLQLRAGYANAPEAIDGLAIDTQSFFGGLTYKAQDNLDIHLNLASDDRENSFVRNSANVGFTYRR